MDNTHILNDEETMYFCIHLWLLRAQTTKTILINELIKVSDRCYKQK